MRTRIWASGIALGAALLVGGTTAATAQTAPAAASVAVVPADEVFIGYYPSSTACHIAGSSMSDDYTCIRKGTRWALYIYV
ncbi:hypothetical protein [Streptomyces venezuelae]|nr:hypothetical protein [Streptomyces venezuelae]